MSRKRNEITFRTTQYILFYLEKFDLVRSKEKVKVKEEGMVPSFLSTNMSRAKRINDLPSRDFLSSGLRDVRCTLRAMRYLRRRVIVPVSVPGNLSFTPHVMVGDSLPPYSRLRQFQLRYLRQHAVLALRV